MKKVSNMTDTEVIGVLKDKRVLIYPKPTTLQDMELLRGAVKQAIEKSKKEVIKHKESTW